MLYRLRKHSVYQSVQLRLYQLLRHHQANANDENCMYFTKLRQKIYNTYILCFKFYSVSTRRVRRSGPNYLYIITGQCRSTSVAFQAFVSAGGGCNSATSGSTTCAVGSSRMLNIFKYAQ
jgi:hypothetical protein